MTTEVDSREVELAIKKAAAAVGQAEAIMIGAGAGMGVDSGLPDFRGNEGFWKAYPPFRGRRFSEMSNPVWFDRDPQQAWGFFGHRYNLYSSAVPHDGFQVLRRFMGVMPEGHFVFTSNVDGQFQKAGFDPDRIVECHGSIHHLQCGGCNEIWLASDLQVEVDMETIRATSLLPECPTCKEVARPNILMFGDFGWLARRTRDQQARMADWVRSVEERRFVSIELGAGTSIPTVRRLCESMPGTLIRINPRDALVPHGAISIPLPAEEALLRIEAELI